MAPRIYIAITITRHSPISVFLVQYGCRWKSGFVFRSQGSPDHFRLPQLRSARSSQFFKIHGNKICHILLKQLHLIIFDIDSVKRPRFGPCTWKKKLSLNRWFQNDYNPMQKGSSCCDIEVMEMNGIVTSLLTYIIAGASAFHRLGVTFMYGMSTLIEFLFCHIFLIILHSIRI